MVGRFENVKVLTKNERTSKNSGKKYYLYNVYSNDTLLNLYSEKNFDFSPEEEVSLLIELSSFNNNVNTKLVGVE